MHGLRPPVRSGAAVAVATPRSRARVAVRDEIKQPAGLVHGGVYASIAESLASVATALRGARAGRDGDGPRPTTRASCARSPRARCTRARRASTAAARRGCGTCASATTTDRTCAVTRMTIAVRPAPRGARGVAGGLSAAGLGCRARRSGAEPARAAGSAPKPVFGQRRAAAAARATPGCVDRHDRLRGGARRAARVAWRRCRRRRRRSGSRSSRPACASTAGTPADRGRCGAARRRRAGSCCRAR